jgi:hypothetical protein
MHIPHHSLLNAMVALEQESWQLDDYLPVKSTSKLDEFKLHMGLNSYIPLYNSKPTIGIKIFSTHLSFNSCQSDIITIQSKTHIFSRFLKYKKTILLACIMTYRDHNRKVGLAKY